jgi:GAF domain-containing protein
VRTSFSSQLLAQMTATSELLVGIEDLAKVLQGLAARAREVTVADYAAISTFDDEGQLTRFIYTGISEDQARRMGHPPSGRGLLGELARVDRPIRLADLHSHPASTGWPAAHPDMSAFLGVPVRAGGRTIGSLYMTRGRGGIPFDEEDELGAVLLSLQAAVSVSAAMARERNGRLFLLEERGRIAHDLHDGTIQSLYAVQLGLGHTVQKLEAEPASARRELSAVRSELDTVIAEIRR